MSHLTPGTKVRTLYQHSATGVVVKPRAENLPLPSPEWCIVQFDADEYGPRGKLCIHRDMLAISNQQ